MLGLYKRSIVWCRACDVRRWTKRTNNCRVFYPAVCKIGNPRALLLLFRQVLRWCKFWRAADGHRLALFNLIRARLLWLHPTSNERGMAFFGKRRLYGWFFNQFNNKFLRTCCTKHTKKTINEILATSKKDSVAQKWFVCVAKLNFDSLAIKYKFSSRRLNNRTL